MKFYLEKNVFFYSVAIEIRFGSATYTFTESDGQQAVKLIKSRASEQTFDVVVGAVGDTETGAILSYDYALHENFFEIRPMLDYVLVLIELYDDNIPEGTEVFQLGSVEVTSGASFDSSVNAVATVSIVDEGDCESETILFYNQVGLIPNSCLYSCGY